MLFKVFLFLLGFGITLISSMYIICYLNLLTLGYNFYQYVNFIIRRFECINILVGILFLVLSMKTGGKNEIYL